MPNNISHTGENGASINIHKQLLKIEWPTFSLILAVYAAWLSVTVLIANGYWIFYLVLAPILTLHSSLQHEIMHGHPTPWQRCNTLLASLPIGLVIPYLRFKDLHLKHHRNWLLTDPFDDTESYFLTQGQWRDLGTIQRALLQINNTLIGRLLLGPLIMLVRFYVSEGSLIFAKTRSVRWHWIQHGLYLIPTISWLYWIDFSVLGYFFLGIWPAISLLMLRAYSEHLPVEVIDQRSAIIPSCRLMGLLYLNNNFHRIHHDKPRLAWYEIPDYYRRHYQQKDLRLEDQTYCPFVSGYWQLLKQYAFRAKFPVVHPFLYAEEPHTKENQVSS